jgi:predicted AlkP superfamily phosphohydrolase/phosphomutase/tetratricopeptide (TPR) repeat protein
VGDSSTGRIAKKVLLIGWDAADWKVIRPLLEAGKMPALNSLIERGTMGDLMTLHPVLSPMIWTSIATGKRPFKHGIAGFTEPNPAGEGIRPVTSLSRKVKALWNILGQNGLRSNVIGWWPSHPAEPINGVMVSNQVQRALPTPDRWPMLPGAVHPERLTETIADLRVHPGNLLPDQILAFVPKYPTIDLEKDRRVFSVAKVLAENCAIHNAATYLIDAEPWDFMAVYYDGIDHFSHGFMKYHPPRQDWISEEDFELYKDVVTSAYIFHDMMLQRLLMSPAVGEDTAIIVISDHGFHPDHLRPKSIPDEPAGPAVEHREHGVFIACGPGIKVDELIHGATVIDIAPTILTLFGLPVGADMDGTPLMGMFDEAAAAASSPPSIPSWEDVPGDAGMHPPDRHMDTAQCREALDQLVALGYIEKPPDDASEAVETTVRELDYNLARSYMDAGLHDQAIPLLARIWGKWPNEHRFGIHLAFCLEVMGRTAEQRRVVETILSRRAKDAEQAREEIQAITEAEAGKEPAPELPLQEQRRRHRLMGLATLNPYVLHYMMGSVCHAEGENDKALNHLNRARRADPRNLSVHLLTARVYLRMKRWGDAEREFESIIQTDPGNAQAHLGLAMSYLPRRRYRKAAVAAMAAVERRYQFPLAHFNLGIALLRLGYVERATQALEVAVSQNPGLVEAHKRLAIVYEKRIGDMEKAEFHSRKVEELRAQKKEPKSGADDAAAIEAALAVTPKSAKPRPKSAAVGAVYDRPGRSQIAPTVIVTGLPRSGTSMMMRMLSSGGFPILTDGIRAADEDNPNGYFEFEPARRLRDDNAWLPQAEGKAVKIVAQLLPWLPPGWRYRVIFMRRDLDEILTSQDAMLARQGREGANLPPEKLRAVFAGQVEEIEHGLASRPDVETLFVEYRGAIEDPARIAACVNAFLGGALDEAAMAAAVDPRLWRRRKPILVEETL